MNSIESFQAVIDASVGITLFVKEPLSEQTHALFGLLTQEPPAVFYVPDLFYIECANVLLKYSRKDVISSGDAALFLAGLGGLALRSTPTQGLVAAALSLASSRKLSAYDACYVALAKAIGVPLLTADGKLVDACRPFGDDVHLLASYSLPKAPPSQ